MTLSTARLEPVPGHLVRFYQEVSRRLELVERVLGVLGASVPLDDVFSREQIERVLGGGSDSHRLAHEDQGHAAR